MGLHEKKGEVRFTKSSKCVLDIGLWLDGNMYARESDYSDRPSCYGGVQECRWCKTLINMTLDEWSKLTYNKTTEEVCKDLGIKYKFNNNNHKKCDLCENHMNVPRWYLCETCKYNYGSNFTLMSLI